MPNYQLAESFDIDDGSLDVLSKQQCFVLGVEWATFHARVLAGEQFVGVCHSSNAPRLSMMVERNGRFVEHHVHAEGWSQLFAGAPCPKTELE